jgi:hypothetical protein
MAPLETPLPINQAQVRSRGLTARFGQPSFVRLFYTRVRKTAADEEVTNL